MSQPPIHPDQNPYGHQEENPYEFQPPYIDSYKENPVAPTPRTGVPSAPPVTSPTAKVPDAIPHRQTPAGLSAKRIAVIAAIILVVILLAGSLLVYARNSVIQYNSYVAATATAQMKMMQAQATGTAAAIATAHAQVTAQAMATATAYASENPYPAFPVVSINDPMLTNSSPQDWYVGDEVDSTNHYKGNCSFLDGYYITAPYYKVPNSNITYFIMCLAQHSMLTDFVYQVRMQIVKGDCGGLAFRSDSGGQKYYFLSVCQDGTYRLRLFKKSLPEYGVDLTAGSSSAIKQGLQQKNLVAVAVHGSTFEIYINRQHVASTSNGEYSSGLLGLAAIPQTKDTEVLFNNVQVWIPA